MHSYRSKKGPFRERPFYSDKDIERICSDALFSVDLYPTSPGPIRIERFIEHRFKVTPEYSRELDAGILGLTIFDKSGVKEVIISSKIDEESNAVVAERRVRSTLAHEAGHGLFHAHLFVLEDGGTPLFGDITDPKKPKILCRDEGGSGNRVYKGEWWEFQANKAIGALLMPVNLVELALEDYMVTTGGLGFKQFDYSNEWEAIRLLTEIFDVNSPVAKIRLNQLFPTQATNQPML